jgi:hypothetical protein
VDWKIGLVGVGVGTSRWFPPSMEMSNFVEHPPVESSTLATLMSMSGQACIPSTYGGEGRSSGVLAPAVEGDAFDVGRSSSPSAIGEKVFWLLSLSDSSSSSEQ